MISINQLSQSLAHGFLQPWGACQLRLILRTTALVFLCGGTACNKSAKPEAVPRSGVGDETIAVIKLDLPTMTEGGRLRERLQTLGQHTSADWSPIGNLVDTLSSNGVNQIAIPVNLGGSMLESMGIYLGGKVGAENEDLETAIIKAGSGTMLGAAALMTAVTDTAGGWKFWGLGGGRISNSSGSVAKRYEKAFAEAGLAPLQLVVLVPAEEILGDINPQPSDPRLIRQISRLLKAAKDIEFFHLSVGLQGELVAGARFRTQQAAASFADSWTILSRDLQLVSGPATSGQTDALFASLFENLGRHTPTVVGPSVRWGK